MTTYLTWLVEDGGNSDMPTDVKHLYPVLASRPAAAAGVAARRASFRSPSVLVGCIRADLMRDPEVCSRRFIVRFDRVVKETRRLP